MVGIGSFLFIEGLSKMKEKNRKNKVDKRVEKRGRGEVGEKEDMSMKEGKQSERKELRSLKGSNL